VSAFTGELTLTHLDADWRRWRLELVLSYEVGALGSGRVVAVPVGFVTDGASVPRPLWWLLPAWGRYSRAAVVHDFLCDRIERGAAHIHAADRRTADAIFYEAMTVCGVNNVIKFSIWLAVRAFAIITRK